MNICPNKNSKEWKLLVEELGEDMAYYVFIANGQDLPALSDIPYVLNKITENNKKGALQKEIDDTNKKIVESLNQKVQETLSQSGIGIEVMDVIENRQNIKGEFDPTKTQKNAEGIVNMIRLAKGQESTMVLTEEFAHAVIASLKNNPIYQRLINALTEQDVRTILDEDGGYQEYYDQYIYQNGDINEILKEEAIGKLLAKSLFNKEKIKQTPIVTNLFNRLINAFKTLWGRLNENQLQNNINNLTSELDKLSTKILDGNFKVDLDAITNNEFNYKLNNLGKKLNNKEEIATKMIMTEHKRLKIIESTKDKSEELEETIAKKNEEITKWETSLNSKKFDVVIADTLGNILGDFKSLHDMVKNLNIKDANLSKDDMRRLAGAMRDVKGYIDAYGNTVKELISYYNIEESQNPEGLSEHDKSMLETANELNKMIASVEGLYNYNVSNIFKQFLKPYFGENDTVITKYHGVEKEVTLDDLLSEATADIGMMDRYLFSMAESGDLLLRLIDKPVKEAKSKARLNTREDEKILKNAGIKLEKAGYNQDFIYKRNKKGQLTGYLLGTIDFVKYNIAKSEHIKKLVEKYGEPNEASKENITKYYKELNDWTTKNTEEVDGERKPKKSLYSDEEFAKLAPAQLEFYNTIISMKEKLDGLLPNYGSSTFLAPQIRKSFIDRLRKSSNISEFGSNIKEWFKDAWLENESDTEFGDLEAKILRGEELTEKEKKAYSKEEVYLGISGFDNKEISKLPVHYRNKLKNMNDLSTDIVSSMIMYSDMANNYNQLHKIVDIMEIGRDIMNQRTVGNEYMGKPMYEQFSRMGTTVNNKILKPDGEKFIQSKMNDFYDAKIYGKESKKEGDLFGTGISKAKTANNINMLTSLTTIALSPLTAVANLTVGTVMMRVEAIAGEYFNYKDLMKADKSYMTSVPSLIEDLGRREKHSKLGLFQERFNIIQEHEQEIMNTKFNEKNVFTKMFGIGSLYFMMKGGENYMHTRTALALGEANKLLLNGKEISVYDAYEVTTDKDGIRRLELKKGVTKLDGTEWTSKDEEAFNRKTAELNHRMHGTYNEEDKAAINRSWFGRLLMMYRKWIIPSINRRFQRKSFNYDMDAYTEGYYNTFGRFLLNVGKDIKNGKLNLIANWKELDSHSKANLKRSLAEIGHYGAIILSLFALSKAWEDDDDDWTKGFVMYQLERLKNEIGVFVPFVINQVDEGIQITKSPMAGVRILDRISDFVKFWNWFDEVPSGSFKGSYKVQKQLFGIVPIASTIDRAMHPWESVKFYRQ